MSPLTPGLSAELSQKLPKFAKLRKFDCQTPTLRANIISRLQSAYACDLAYNLNKGVCSMVTRELVQAELERLSADELSKVYRYIKQVAYEKPKSAKKKSLMASLSAIEIEAPQDFSANHDLYASKLN